MKNYFYCIANHLVFTVLLSFAGLVHCFSQGFSPQVQTRLQFILDSFQNNTNPAYVGGMSVAIKSEGLAFWQGATGFAARNIDDQNNLLPGGTTRQQVILIINVTGSKACSSLPECKAFRFNSNRHSSHISRIGVILKTVENELQPCLYLRRKALRKAMDKTGK